jgi:hypothetical protein
MHQLFADRPMSDLQTPDGLGSRFTREARLSGTLV